MILAVVVLAWTAGCATRTTSRPPLDARTILGECGTTNVTKSSVVAWAADLSAAAVVGRRGTNHVLIITYCEPSSQNPYLRRWAVAETSIMWSDGNEMYDTWVIGEREFPRPPTRRDVLGLCAELLWDNAEKSLSECNINPSEQPTVGSRVSATRCRVR